jgi:DNA/RNA-binding domain of Phe-tRNA-synthetase-like protein
MRSFDRGTLRENEMEDSLRIIISGLIRNKAPTLFVKSRMVRDVHVSPPPLTLEERKKETIARWTKDPGVRLETYPLIMVYRELQKQLGGDPQMLPAVESLLVRGILKHRFPTVSSVVDAANLVSIKHLVPIGLFDLDKITGELELTLSAPGDQFIPIGKDKSVKLVPETPILKDVDGVFSAVGSRDSKRTMITGATRNVLVFSWGIEGVDPALVSQVLEECATEIWNTRRST